MDFQTEKTSVTRTINVKEVVVFLLIFVQNVFKNNDTRWNLILVDMSKLYSITFLETLEKGQKKKGERTKYKIGNYEHKTSIWCRNVLLLKTVFRTFISAIFSVNTEIVNVPKYI